MLKKGEKRRVVIRSLGHRAEGVGELDGFVLFIEGALPGEECLIEITQIKKGYGRGKLLELISSSKMRIAPYCPFFSACGGCQLQHLCYEEQLKEKKIRIGTALQKIAGESPDKVFDPLPAPFPFRYRNKVELAVKVRKGKIEVGLCEKHSHNIVCINACPLLYPPLEDAMRKILPLVRDCQDSKDLIHILLKVSYREGRVLCVLEGNKERKASFKMLCKQILQHVPQVSGVLEKRGDDYFLLHGEKNITEVLLGKQFLISPASFFQVNPLQAEKIYQIVIEKLRSLNASFVLDAYCGVGTLSLLLSSAVKHVVGVEIVPEAIEDAKESARINCINNVEFICAPVEKVIREQMQDFVVLNPPRKGVDRQVIAAILEKKPSDVLYVSCDPATLARDIALLKAGGYTLQGLQPVDMFAQTFHIESVAHLSYVE